MEILETKGRKMNKIKREEREDLHTFSDTTGIHGGLRLESVTPMALKHSFSNIIKDNIRINKWQNVETFQ